MANELNIVLAESGATVTCQPYQAGAAVGSPISLTEIGTSAVYSGNMTGAAGTYLLAFHDGTENVGVGTIVWSGTAEVPVSTLTTGDLPTVPSVTDIRAELAPELANLDASVSSRLADADYTAPTAAPTVADIRAELATELGRIDAAISTRSTLAAGDIPTADITAIKAKTDNLPAAPAAASDIPSSDITAIKAKTDALNTERLANVPTVNILGTLLAQANS